MKDKSNLIKLAQAHFGVEITEDHCPEGVDPAVWDLLDKSQFKITNSGKVCMPIPYDTRTNLQTILQNDTEFATLGYNPHSDKLLWKGAPFEEVDIERVGIYLEKYRMRVKDGAIKSGVTAAAMENQFEPIKDYLEGLQWDKKPRIDNLLIDQYCADFETNYTDLVQAMSSRWLISAVARIIDPGCEVHTCIALISVAKGVGKGFSLKALAGEEYFSNSNLDIGSKRGYMAIHQSGVWIWELAEMASLQGKSAESFKAFITGAWDRYTANYGKFPKHRPRRTVIALSANNVNILSDGPERRIWPILIKHNHTIDIDYIKDNRDQLWAEAVHRYKSGEPWHLDTKQLRDDLEAYQMGRFMIDDPWTPKVLEHLITGGKSTTEIMDHLELPISQQHTGNSKRIAQICKELGYVQKVKNRQRRWVKR